MLPLLLLLIPLVGIFIISTRIIYIGSNSNEVNYIALITLVVNLLVSLVMWILFDFSSNQFQFVQECYEFNEYSVYLGVDGLSIYFVLLTTIIMPIALLSNWSSIIDNKKSFVIIILLLETLLLAVFLVLDIFLFYIFFESILPPLFLLMGLFGSTNKTRASFYLFLYTLKNQCLRAKFRGSPKALITKLFKET
jgi:NADH-ubiquinone oxidoreductase chain 4